MNRLALIGLLLGGPAVAGMLDEGRSLIEAGKYREARAVLEQAPGNADEKAERLVLLTRVCNALEDYACGVDRGERAVELLPDDSNAHFLYAEALRIKMQKVSRMKALFVVGSYKKMLRRAIDLDPQNLDAREEEIGFLTQAPGIAGGDRDRARERIADLKALDWRRGMVMQAELQFREKQDDDAVRTLRRVLEKHPNDAGSRFSLAYGYQRNEHYAEADREFAGLTVHENSAVSMSALYQRARTRILGRYELAQAVEFLLDYIERVDGVPRVPSKSNAYWRLGNAYEQLSAIAKARRAYQQSLALDPDNGEAAKALRALGG